MTHLEKIDLLKETITYLYEKEGRSKSYIARVLVLERTVLSRRMNEWGLVKADERHMTPSNQKFLNKNRKIIIDMLDSDKQITEIAKAVGKSRDSLTRTFIQNDKELLHHYNESKKRLETAAADRKQKKMDESPRDYETETICGEEWRDILGYTNYQVSSHGRIRHYSETYKKAYLLNPSKNSKTGRMYVMLRNDQGIRRNLNLARIVGHAFVEGFSEENNTIDHLDGNPQNNNASNLQWVSQSENNIRAFKNGKPGHKGYTRNKKFKCIIMDKKYEFKTIVALAKFLGVSQTQAGRYLSGESKSPHTFRFVYPEDYKKNKAS